MTTKLLEDKYFFYICSLLTNTLIQANKIVQNCSVFYLYFPKIVVKVETKKNCYWNCYSPGSSNKSRQQMESYLTRWQYPLIIYHALMLSRVQMMLSFLINSLLQKCYSFSKSVAVGSCCVCIRLWLFVSLKKRSRTRRLVRYYPYYIIIILSIL